MKLYGYWRSSSSYRVRILLGLKGLEYESVAVHLLEDGGQQNHPQYARKNPFRQVPLLEIEGPSEPLYLSQSMAIAEFLEEAHPQPSLYPSDPWSRAQARELAEIVNSGIQPLQNLRVLRSLKASGVDVKGWCREVIARGFAAIETRLALCAGDHAVGSTLGLVEAFLIPQLYAARRFEVELEPYPTLLRVESACIEHPAFVAAHPDAQPDAPPPELRTP